MRILLDECLPRKFALLLTGHEVRNVRAEGWSGIKNGELLKLAQSRGFQVFITVDRNLPYQQNSKNYPLGIIVLAARSNKLADIMPLTDYVMKALPHLQAGKVITIGA